MIVPTSVVSALLIVVLVVPGFVFVSLRGTLRGPRGIQDTDLSSRLAGAIVVSVMFDAAYLVFGGLVLKPADVYALTTTPVETLSEQPVVLGLVVLLFGVAAPAAFAFALYYRVEFEPAPEHWPRWAPAILRRPVRRGGFRNFPTAWDRAAAGLGGTFVRVRLEDGRWVGGWYSSESFVSSYPHDRDLYIERQYVMRKDGTFGRPIESSSGVWLAITDSHVVEWLTSPFMNEEGEQHDEP